MIHPTSPQGLRRGGPPRHGGAKLEEHRLGQASLPGTETVFEPSPLCRRALGSLLEHGFRHKVRLSYKERAALRKKRRIRPSTWAERHRIVTETAYKGPWKNELTPYLAGIMDASFFPSVQEIYICKVPQSGGSECCNNCLGYIIDRCPGPAMLVYPDEETAKENSRDRIQPMITNSPRLTRYVTGREDDLANKRINLANMTIYFAWASSVARLANKPICYGIGDETDKYVMGKKETGPLNLLRARLTTFRLRRKLWLVSSPSTEDGPIWQALTREAEVIFDFQVRCPSCGGYHVMEFDQVKWEKGPKGEHPSPTDMEKKHLAWYECPLCSARWSDAERDRAARKGRWVARDTGDELFSYLRKMRPGRIGFHLPAWPVHFISLSESAAAFLRGLEDFDALKHFYNAFKATPWKKVVRSADEELILAARADLEPLVVPSQAVGLTCGIDMQKNGFWFAVRAWARDMTSWLIQYGFVATWEELEMLFFDMSWPCVDESRRFYLSSVALDTGGGEKYQGFSMTEEAYWHIREYRARGLRIFGVKGASRPLELRMKTGQPIDRTPSGKPLPGGIRIVSIDTAQMKDLFFWRVEQARHHLSQAAYCHREIDREYRLQVTAEEKRKDQRGAEYWVAKRKANHLLDAEVYCHAAADPQWPGGSIVLFDRKRPAASTTRGKGSPSGGIVRGVARSSFLSR